MKLGDLNRDSRPPDVAEAIIGEAIRRGYSHEYTPENTYINPFSGGRVCRTCRANRLARLSPEALARERESKREWMRARRLGA